MPPSSVAARSLALAVIGVGAASFAAHGQNVTAFNPYSGAGRPDGLLPHYAAPSAAPAADAAGPGPVAGPAFNPWSSPAPALASRKAAASLPPPPPGPIKSRVVAVPELATSPSKPRGIAKAGAADVRSAVEPASMPTAPPVAAAPAARSSVAASLVFTVRSTELSDACKLELDRLAKDLADRTLWQVELRRVSENGDPDGRKISLARALIVRNYLIDKGVRSRIEIASIVGGGGERVEIMVLST